MENLEIIAFEELLNSELKKHINKCQVALFSGSLLYVENWKQAIQRILETKPDFVYLCRTLFNENLPTFACQQDIVPGSGPWQGKYIGSVGIHIFNPDEMIDWFSKHGYEVVNDAFVSDYSNELRSLPQLFRKSAFRDILFQVKE